MPAPLVLSAGTQFGGWTLLSEAPRKGKHRYLWCRCVCGTERAVSLNSLRAGSSISCGCSWRAAADAVSVGTVFGRLTVLSEAPASRWGPRVLCRCTCGTQHVVATASLRTGLSTSCGCLWRETITKHGMWARPEYKVWAAMIQRCHNPRVKPYANYGGRGIQVCDRWRRSFVAFLRDVGRRPSPDLTLDRIDNDGNYEPGNVRWATWTEQAHNKRPRQTQAATL
jgi:hypothetical protein